MCRIKGVFQVWNSWNLTVITNWVTPSLPMVVRKFQLQFFILVQFPYIRNQLSLKRMKVNVMVMLRFIVVSFGGFTKIANWPLYFPWYKPILCFCFWIFNFRLWLLLFKTLNLRGTFNSFSNACIAIQCLPLSISFFIFCCFWVFECALCNSVKFCFLFFISSISITFGSCCILCTFSTSVMIKCSIWILQAAYVIVGNLEVQSSINDINNSSMHGS